MGGGGGGGEGRGKGMAVYSLANCSVVYEVNKTFDFCCVFFVSKLIFYTNLGPVVQSVVSLTSSLRVISLTILADSIYNILIFFAEKM